MRRWLAIVPLLALAALAVLFTLRLKDGGDSHYTPTALVGKPMPDEALPPLAGGPPTPLKGEVRPATLVNFFASWCAPCEIEAPQLNALKARGVRIVGVAYKDKPENTKAMLARLGDPFTETLVDADGRAGLEFGVSGVPETFLVGPDGRILAKHTGPLTPDTAEALLETAKSGR
jgi:cytochrome c biogenesis protein CcmG/thiol:disulfide interchange protein DsbE